MHRQAHGVFLPLGVEGQMSCPPSSHPGTRCCKLATLRKFYGNAVDGRKAWLQELLRRFVNVFLVDLHWQSAFDLLFCFDISA